MRSGIHPEYHEIVIETTNGGAYTTRSTWGKAGEKMKLEIDPDTHPAWTGGIQKVLEGGQVARFGRRFQGKTFTAKASAPAAAKPAVAKAKPAAPAVKKPEVKKAAEKPAADTAAAPAADAAPNAPKAE
ncbi:MAG: 50S ribosomal protein L31 [Hydrotalea sp.]|nr:50S ribosomal protein L31 [Hydrotalea sp.]